MGFHLKETSFLANQAWVELPTTEYRIREMWTCEIVDGPRRAPSAILQGV